MKRKIRIDERAIGKRMKNWVYHNMSRFYCGKKFHIFRSITSWIRWLILLPPTEIGKIKANLRITKPYYVVFEWIFHVNRHSCKSADKNVTLWLTIPLQNKSVRTSNIAQTSRQASSLLMIALRQWMTVRKANKHPINGKKKWIIYCGQFSFFLSLVAVVKQSINIIKGFFAAWSVLK